MNLKKWTTLATACAAMAAVQAKDKASDLPLLLIGGSYSEGKTPFNNGIAPLGGISVGFGSYISLGTALIRDERLPGYVINEGQAGATTFPRPYCPPGSPTCGPASWDGFQTQFDRALARVALPPTFTTYNARYVVITAPNDCLHADAFGVPQALSQPCTPAQINGVADRLIAVGQSALARGLTPIYDVHPRYEDLDLPLFRSMFGLAWVIGETDYRALRDLVRMRLRAELAGALVLDIWKDFRHGGDGVHPDAATVRKAARTIAQEIHRRGDGGR
ncbi:SGNH/GDSL hydrolase family protein [Aquincola sp. S2]|uniref:SGNH/GDSL hydrolase family protein n=1 Tax=Pseudaquabacterium terrae TaxID=2732868 RepID=A0ABX2EMW4_9BURK|nr:SGNH/GDSL hydrolase family protein [Aquabacterium terrae]NRF70007.1 SGNH/GDSL hydrolase family protein [Aquabacterium terrae]